MQTFVRVALCAALFLNYAGLSSAKMLIETDNALSKIYPNATTFDPRSIALSDEQIKLIEKKARIIFGESHSGHIQYYRVEENDQVTGYAFEDIVIGKWGPIRYLVGLDENGTVLQVIILDYQEIRGKPIAKKRFLRQYKNKSIDDPVKLRKDIDGVTGATISSRSLTDGIRKLLFIFEEIIIK